MIMITEIPHIKEFKVGDESLDVDALLKHPFEDIREAAEALPAAMAWLGWQRSRFQELMYKAEVAVKTAKGRVYHNYKANGLEADGYSGKATETAVEHAINIHPDVTDAHDTVAKYTRIISNLTAYIYAMERKIELVRTGEATHRRVSEQEPLTDEELEVMAQTKIKGES